jgi:hypothetical protein
LRAFPAVTHVLEPAVRDPAKPRRHDEPIAVSLEDHIPANYFNRHLGATLDLGIVHEWTREGEQRSGGLATPRP